MREEWLVFKSLRFRMLDLKFVSETFRILPGPPSMDPNDFLVLTRMVDYMTDSKTDDFIRKWIFPGGFLPSVSFTTACIDKGSQGRLNVDSIVNIGPHYARTLREWRIRFLMNFERDIRPALKDEHPEMTEEDIMVFKRKWICESRTDYRLNFSIAVVADYDVTLFRLLRVL